MNVYDFDKTIYKNDSSLEFYRYCLAQHPSIARYWPRQAAAAVRYKSGRWSKTQMKQVFFSFLRSVPDVEAALAAFWAQRIGGIQPWYRAQQQEDDVIISASPTFVVAPACEQLGIRHLLASPVDPHSGLYSGENCHGPEKVVRFKAAFPDAVVDAFYSDSLSDTPMAQIAQQSFLVKGDRLEPWPTDR